jgi:diguanylate cyclase (GGDEF)-like protein
MKRERRFRLVMVTIFAVSAVTAIAQGYAFHRTVTEYTEVVEKASGVVDRLRSARKLHATILDAESGQRGYLLTGDPAYREPFDRALAQVEARLKEFRQAQPPERSRDVADVVQTVEAKMSILRETLRLYDSQGYAAALALVKTGQSKAAMDKMVAILERFISEDSAASAKLHKDIARDSVASSMSWIALNIAIGIGLLAGMAGLWRASRKIGELASELEHEAHHDGLTGLPNRAFFKEALGYILALAARENRRVAVLFLDLNGFKSINDRLGHDKGDLALVEVAKALKGVLRESDFAARLGGDEFTVIVSSIKDACIMCDRIEAAISAIAPPELRGYALGTSIGVSVFPEDGHHADALIAVADARMFEQKRARKAGTAIPICVICKGDPAACPSDQTGIA